MATSSVYSIPSSRISWQFLLLTGSICPICSGCFPLVSVVSPLVLLWCVFWVPSGPGANCLVSHLTVSCSTCITTFLTVICASPCLYPDMFNAWRIEKDCTIDYPAQRWIFLLRGRSHITSAKSWHLLTEGGGVYKPPFLADVICEQPLRERLCGR